MKRFFLILGLLVAVTGNLLAEDGETVSDLVKRNFEKEFPGATSAKWERMESPDMYQVRFVYHNQSLLAYINDEGGLIATARNIDLESVPFRVGETISKRFANYQVSQVEELTTVSGTSYMFMLENEKTRLLIRVYNSGTFSEVKKEKRK